MHMWMDHITMGWQHSDAVKQNEYFESNTAVRGQTSTLPDLYSYFVFLFPLIPQTHIRL